MANRQTRNGSPASSRWDVRNLFGGNAAGAAPAVAMHPQRESDPSKTRGKDKYVAAFDMKDIDMDDDLPDNGVSDLELSLIVELHH